jgi:hypothetical protein
MIFKIFSPKHLAKILAFFAQTPASFCKHLIITLDFEKNAMFDFFDAKLAKIGENCDHNIDPQLEHFQDFHSYYKSRVVSLQREAGVNWWCTNILHKHVEEGRCRSRFCETVSAEIYG